MKLGCVDYINALPYTLPFRLNKIKTNINIKYGPPTTLNSALRAGELDTALSSSVEYLDGDYHLVHGFGIIADQEILSVNLYTKQPVHSLTGARLGITPHSATSSALLKILCHVWQIEPHFEPLSEKEPYSNYDALLLIGDEALKNLTLPGFETIDLAKAWYEITKLPFVFAVFATRKEIDTTNLAVQLQEALHWSEKNRELLEQEAHLQTQLPLELIRKYYSLCKYHLGERELEGLEKFKNLREHVSTVSP